MLLASLFIPIADALCSINHGTVKKKEAKHKEKGNARSRYSFKSELCSFGFVKRNAFLYLPTVVAYSDIRAHVRSRSRDRYCTSKALLLHLCLSFQSILLAEKD